MLTPESIKSDRLQQKLYRELGGDILGWLASDTVLEVLLNPDGRLWVHDRLGGLIYSGQKMSAVSAMNLIGTVGNLSDRTVHAASPILECELPGWGHRFQAVIPPVTSSPVFSIRKHPKHIFSLTDYVDQGILTLSQANSLRKAIVDRKTILIVGGPGTGKTTFANALLDEMVKQSPHAERILILEDTPELQLRSDLDVSSTSSHAVFLRTSPSVGFQELLRASLRLRPDRICMGECRGVEMLTLLKCWNTGTPGGLATIHANSAKAALVRIQEMVAESGSDPQPQLIVEAVNIIVSISCHSTGGRTVNEILELTGYDHQDFRYQTLVERSPSLCLHLLSD